MRSLLVSLLIAFVLGELSPLAAADVSLISKEELKNKLGSDAVVVIDVRTGSDWSSSEFKIQGAVREDPEAVDSWASNYSKNLTVVLYCA